MHYFVYMITNKFNTTLYIGVTNNLQRRMLEHKMKIYPGFSKKYNLTKLIYYEVYESAEEMIRREKQLKKWKRRWKEDLINENNSRWNDLTKDPI